MSSRRLSRKSIRKYPRLSKGNLEEFKAVDNLIEEMKMEVEQEEAKKGSKRYSDGKLKKPGSSSGTSENNSATGSSSVKSLSLSSNAVEKLPLKNKDSKKVAENNGKTHKSEKFVFASTKEVVNGENRNVKTVGTVNEESENSLKGVHVNQTNVSSIEQSNNSNNNNNVENKKNENKVNLQTEDEIKEDFGAEYNVQGPIVLSLNEDNLKPLIVGVEKELLHQRYKRSFARTRHNTVSCPLSFNDPVIKEVMYKELIFMDVCEDLEKKDMLLDEEDKVKVTREVLESTDGDLTLQQLITAKVKALNKVSSEDLIASTNTCICIMRLLREIESSGMYCLKKFSSLQDIKTETEEEED